VTTAGLRLVFAGTPEFAARQLDTLLDGPHPVVAVYTRPDRPAGRGRRPRASPVKALALARGLPLRQPQTLRGADAAHALAELAPDVVVVAAYGLILPADVLAVPARGCLNVHASLLPRWRGAAPVQRAILAGDRGTGISIMQMDAGLDTGPVIAREPCPIHSDDTAGSLEDRLAALGAGLLPRALDAVRGGTAVATPQTESLATWASRVRSEEALLDWRDAAVALERAVRAFDPWPVARTRRGEEALRVLGARVLEPDATAGAPGGVLAAGAAGIDVACGRGVLRLTRVQRPGGRPLPVRDYLNARPLAAGSVLGAGRAAVS